MRRDFPDEFRALATQPYVVEHGGFVHRRTVLRVDEQTQRVVAITSNHPFWWPTDHPASVADMELWYRAYARFRQVQCARFRVWRLSGHFCAADQQRGI